MLDDLEGEPMTGEPVPGGSPADNSDAIRETLLADANQLITARQAGLATADRVYALAFTLLAAAVGLFVSDKGRFLVLPIPFLLCLLLAYQAQVSADVKVIGIYRAHLEKQINSTLGSRLLAYENGAARARSGRVSPAVRYTAWLLMATISLLAVAVGWYCAALYWPVWWPFLVYCLLTAAAFAVLIVSGLDEKQSRSKAHALLRAYIEDGDGLLEDYDPDADLMSRPTKATK